jgi:hypothetical protein
VRGQALARTRTTAISGHAVSDFVHVNRVEGLALGANVMQHLGGGLSVVGGATYGFSDHGWKPRGGVAYRRPSGAGLTLTAYRTLHEVSDLPERSGVINSFAAQEFGSDYSDLYRVRGAALTMASSLFWPIRGSFELAVERHDSASVHATPVTGSYAPTLPLPAFRETRLTVGADIPTRTIGGTTLRLQTRVSAIRGHTIGSGYNHTWLRGSLLGEATHAFGEQTLLVRTTAAALSNSTAAPPEHRVFFGGPITGPGYDAHSLVSRAALSQRLEWQFKVPFVGIPLGAWGRAPATLTVAPYANAVWLEGSALRPSVGVGALTLFDLLRFDVAKGIKDGRWIFSFDVSRDFWAIL